MATSTPKYTPIRHYAIGFFLSAILLYSDITYGAFTPLRGLANASSLYAQMISNGLLENISNTFYSFQKNRNLLIENKELQEQILQIRTRDFIERKNSQEKIKIIDFQKELISSLNNNNIHIYKIASIDLRNYLCCSTHRIFLQNTKNVSMERNVPVFAGTSYVGQTKNRLCIRHLGHREEVRQGQKGMGEHFKERHGENGQQQVNVGFIPVVGSL